MKTETLLFLILQISPSRYVSTERLVSLQLTNYHISSIQYS